MLRPAFLVRMARGRACSCCDKSGTVYSCSITSLTSRQKSRKSLLLIGRPDLEIVPLRDFPTDQKCMALPPARWRGGACAWRQGVAGGAYQLDRHHACCLCARVVFPRSTPHARRLGAGGEFAAVLQELKEDGSSCWM